jgi:AraC-like DNA-binding protein
MQRVFELETFLAAPIGQQLIAKHFAYWYPARDLTGFALWGNPGRCDVELLNRAMDVVLLPSGGRHLSLVDMQHLGTVDPTAFRAMADYVASRWRGFSETIVKQALIRPSGFAGAVVAGFYAVVTPRYPVQVFDDLAPALTWLGIDQRAEFRSAVEATRTVASYTDPVVGQLRSLLAEPTSQLSLVDLARKLGTSPRTLQRRLQSAGTSFQTEFTTAKLAQAQHLMLNSGLTLTTIALELGFASLQHFSARFRKLHGHSPSAWLRKRQENPLVETCWQAPAPKQALGGVGRQ